MKKKSRHTSGANFAYSSIQLCSTLRGHTTKKGLVWLLSRKYAEKAIVCSVYTYIRMNISWEGDCTTYLAQTHLVRCK